MQISDKRQRSCCIPRSFKALQQSRCAARPYAATHLALLALSQRQHCLLRCLPQDAPRCGGCSMSRQLNALRGCLQHHQRNAYNKHSKAQRMPDATLSAVLLCSCLLHCCTQAGQMPRPCKSQFQPSSCAATQARTFKQVRGLLLSAQSSSTAGRTGLALPHM